MNMYDHIINEMLAEMAAEEKGGHTKLYIVHCHTFVNNEERGHTEVVAVCDSTEQAELLIQKEHSAQTLYWKDNEDEQTIDIRKIWTYQTCLMNTHITETNDSGTIAECRN